MLSVPLLERATTRPRTSVGTRSRRMSVTVIRTRRGPTVGTRIHDRLRRPTSVGPQLRMIRSTIMTSLAPIAVRRTERTLVWMTCFPDSNFSRTRRRYTYGHLCYLSRKQMKFVSHMSLQKKISLPLAMLVDEGENLQGVFDFDSCSAGRDSCREVRCMVF